MVSTANNAASANECVRWQDGIIGDNSKILGGIKDFNIFSVIISSVILRQPPDLVEINSIWSITPPGSSTDEITEILVNIAYDWM